jgi:acyl-CoA synthetase (AMP-forming)/AMP-acid ligase II
MRGLMMDTPLSIISLTQFAAINHSDTEIVSRTVEGPLHRYTYGDSYRRMQSLAHVLRGLDVDLGTRVATLAWNGFRHFELYYAVSGIGAVCHTVNPRLTPEQIRFILDHAGDQVVFTDLSFVGLLEGLCEQLPNVKAYVVMTDRDHMPQTRLRNVFCYEEEIAKTSDHFAWPALDENTASSLCYSSGTTGEPKGTLYSHRSTVLHALAAAFPDNFAYSSSETVLPVVPLFHVNAWGVPYACPMVGAKIVFPGAGVDPRSLFELIQSERVTFALGVPTIWAQFLEYLRTTGARPSHLKRITSGGSAVPPSMISAYAKEFGIEIRQGWGMTEMSPIGLQGTLKGKQLDLGEAEKLRVRSKQGRPVYGVDVRIVDSDGEGLPRDGIAFGELCVRGPWVLSAYYDNPKASENSFDADGWFHTGDVATIDGDGFVQIVDRTKDVIKSGGEWISSIEIESVASGHPDIAEAAVIGLPHPRWGERPLLLVVAKPGRSPARQEIVGYLADRLPKLAVPDDVLFVGSLPRNATGKILKTKLREEFAHHKFQSA